MIKLTITGIDTRYYANSDVDRAKKLAERFNRVTGRYVSVYREEIVSIFEEKEKVMNTEEQITNAMDKLSERLLSQKDAVQAGLEWSYRYNLRDFAEKAKYFIQNIRSCTAHESENNKDPDVLIALDEIREAIESINGQINFLYEKGNK